MRWCVHRIPFYRKPIKAKQDRNRIFWDESAHIGVEYALCPMVHRRSLRPPVKPHSETCEWVFVSEAISAIIFQKGIQPKFDYRKSHFQTFIYMRYNIQSRSHRPYKFSLSVPRLHFLIYVLPLLLVAPWVPLCHSHVNYPRDLCSFAINSRTARI